MGEGRREWRLRVHPDRRADDADDVAQHAPVRRQPERRSPVRGMVPPASGMARPQPRRRQRDGGRCNLPAESLLEEVSLPDERHDLVRPERRHGGGDGCGYVAQPQRRDACRAASERCTGYERKDEADNHDRFGTNLLGWCCRPRPHRLGGRVVRRRELARRRRLGGSRQAGARLERQPERRDQGHRGDGLRGRGTGRVHIPSEHVFPPTGYL